MTNKKYISYGKKHGRRKKIKAPFKGIQEENLKKILIILQS